MQHFIEKEVASQNSVWMLLLNNYFSDINETLVDCVPDSKIDPQIVQNISWLPLVSYLKEKIEIFCYFNLF